MDQQTLKTVQERGPQHNLRPWSGFTIRHAYCLIGIITPDEVPYLEQLEIFMRAVMDSALILVSEDYDVVENTNAFQNFTKNIIHFDHQPESNVLYLSIFFEN